MHVKRLIATLVLSFGLILVLFTSLPTALAGPSGNLFVIPQPSGLLPACTQSDPCGLRSAVNRAVNGDTIYIADGTYTGTTDAVLTVTKSITVYGGWNGAPSGATVRAPDHFKSILNGQGLRRGVYISGDITPTLDGLFITNGSSTSYGGGIYAEAAHPIINGCRIYSNTASNANGGGIYILNGSLARLTGNQVYSNAASNCGGIDLLDSPTVTLSSNQVYSNFVPYGGGGLCLQNAPAAQLVGNSIRSNRAISGNGGGLVLDSSPRLNLSGNEIYQNAGLSGGGVFLSGNDTSLLANNQIYSNTAERGGGLYLFFNPTISLTNNLVHDNSASNDAGGLYMVGSPTTTLIGNQFYRNAANTYSGVAIHSSPTTTLIRNQVYGNIANLANGIVCGLGLTDSDNALLVNNVIVDNQSTSSAGKGPGLRLSHSSAQLIHTTVARNTGGDGVGIFLDNNNGDIILTNTILVNQATSLRASSGNTVTVNGVLWNDNLVNVTGVGAVTVTSAMTGFPAFAADGYHLMVCSSAINAGVDVGVLDDIDDDVRPTDGAYDLGADEYIGGGTCRRVYLPVVLK